jgi:hypothetical protein
MTSEKQSTDAATDAQQALSVTLKQSKQTTSKNKLIIRKIVRTLHTLVATMAGRISGMMALTVMPAAAGQAAVVDTHALMTLMHLMVSVWDVGSNHRLSRVLASYACKLM